MVTALVSNTGSTLRLELANPAGRGVQLAVLARHLPQVGMQRSDVAPFDTRLVTLPAARGRYDVAVHGPDGFVRELRGDAASTLAGLEATACLQRSASGPVLQLELHNADGVTRTLRVADGGGRAHVRRLASRSTDTLTYGLTSEPGGWYDLTISAQGITSFKRRFAGRVGHLDATPGQPGG